MADLLAEVKDLIAAGVDPTVAANTVNAERARRAQQDDAGSTRSQLLLSAQRDFLFLFQSSVAGEVSGELSGVKRDRDVMMGGETAAISSFSQVEVYKKAGLLCHRPNEKDYGTHVSLMCKPFGEFMDNVRNVQLDREDYSFVHEFCARMCEVYRDESQRQWVATQLLSSYFEGWIPSRGTSRLMMSCGERSLHQMVGFIVECTSELGSTKSALWEPSIACFMKSSWECPFARDRCVCPSLMMKIAGPNLGISAVVQAAGTCVDPLVPLLPTLVLKYDKAMMSTLGRALKATKLCIQELKKLYRALKDEQPSVQETDQLLFPYPRSFTFEGRDVPFTYSKTMGAMGRKLVFSATVGEGEHSLTAGLPIVVKFAATYCVEAHECCYAFEQSAPRLYAHSMLPGGWHLLVMESLDGADFVPKQESDTVQAQLRRVVQNLHGAGFVHGDLRECNIRVVGERVCLIDFDWTGRAGEQRYPGFMNHVGIKWAPGASDGLPLQPEHDLHFFKGLIE